MKKEEDNFDFLNGKDPKKVHFLLLFSLANIYILFIHYSTLLSDFFYQYSHLVTCAVKFHIVSLTSTIVGVHVSVCVFFLLFLFFCLKDFCLLCECVLSFCFVEMLGGLSYSFLFVRLSVSSIS